MAYDDMNDGYDDLLNTPSNNVEIWNSRSVYYDDEIVEYQGKHYIALCKTSAEVPGRCKPGIWKEIKYTEEGEHDLDMTTSSYDESLLSTPSLDDDVQLHKKKMQAQSTVAQRNKKAAEVQQRSATAQTKAVQTKASAAAGDKSAAKSVSKPSTMKSAVAQPQPQNIERKMTVAPNDQNIVNEVLRELNFKKIKGLNTDDSSITSNLLLPQKAAHETTLTWESSHPDVISSNGEVTRPTDGHDVAVNLAVSVSKNRVSSKRFFTLWVKAVEVVYSDEECVDMIYDILDFDQIKGKNEKVSAITENLELLTHGLYDTEIIWASKNRVLLSETGEFFRANLTRNTRVRLYAIIIKGNAERLKHFDLTLKL